MRNYYLYVAAMFTPTHIAHINEPGGPRVVALQRTHVMGELEVFRDSDNAEFHQWGDMGIELWTEYQIRALGAHEVVRAQALRPVGPPAVAQYRSRGLSSYISEPAMQTC